jgi:hypothetical protein
VTLKAILGCDGRSTLALQTTRVMLHQDINIFML